MEAEKKREQGEAESSQVQGEGSQVSTEGIPESMLHALYARAKESEREGCYVYDRKAMEVVKGLDYDFFRVEKEISMGKGVLARTILLDKMVAEYVSAHPDAVVINLACGVDTRFYRVDNGSIRWYDLDLPEVIEARKRLLGAQERGGMIAKSAMDDTWAEEVEAKGPVLVIVENFTMYLEEQAVGKLFQILRAHFPQAEVYVEVASEAAVKNITEKTEEGSRPKYTWGVKSRRQLEKLAVGFKAVKCETLMEGLKEMYPVYHVLRFFPPMRKVANKIFVLRGK